MSFPTEQLDPGTLLAQARAGCGQSLGHLLQAYQAHLQVLADGQLTGRLRARVNPSDIVQETFLRASRHFDDFAGTTEPEFAGWVRGILRRCLLEAVQKEIAARKRSLACEVSLQAADSQVFVGQGSSPSAGATRKELADAIARRLAQLPPDYREVLILRHWEGLPFNEVASRMGRTSGAVRVLWLRALEKLRAQAVPGDWP
jgi:RNA polymerase sigma-70 factor (ECF subfamily)